MKKEETFREFNQMLNLFLEYGYIINSKNENDSEIVLQKDGVQIDLTNLMTFKEELV
jgi:hypothetical protein